MRCDENPYHSRHLWGETNARGREKMLMLSGIADVFTSDLKEFSDFLIHWRDREWGELPEDVRYWFNQWTWDITDGFIDF